jgi:hypothetical protein
LSEYRRANHVDVGENNDAEKYCEHDENKSEIAVPKP